LVSFVTSCKTGYGGDHFSDGISTDYEVCSSFGNISKMPSEFDSLKEELEDE
jgi:hypothetical protein